MEVHLGDIPLCRFHLPPVPALLSPFLAEHLERRLAVADLRLLRVESADALLELPANSGPCLLELRGAVTSDVVQDLIRRRTDLPLIVLLGNGGSQQALTFLAQTIAEWKLQLLSLPSDEAGLARMVLETRFWAWSDRIQRDIAGASGLDLRVRAMLAWTLRRRLRPPDLSGLAPEWSMKALAQDMQRPRKSVSKLTSAAGVDLREVGDVWIALLALMLHELNGVRWEQVAWRAGYRRLSGLSELMRRVFDKGLRELSGAGIDPGLRRFEEVVARITTA
jgi:hypothetical protein